MSDPTPSRTAFAHGLYNLRIHWTPSHAGVYGNELTDQVAKRSAEEKEERADQNYLTEASLSYLTRKND